MVLDAAIVELRWPALGTTAVLLCERACVASAREAVCGELRAIDAAASRFRTDSELSRLSATPGRRVPVSELLAEAIDVALAAASETGGAVDPTLGADLAALGYDRDHALLRRAAPGAPIDFRPAMTRPRAGWFDIELGVDPPWVSVPDGITLDLGATAKALAADRAARAVRAATGSAALVSLGGDLSTIGDAPGDGWPVRVTDDHRDRGDTGQQVLIQGGGLATSSLSTRRWSQSGRVRHHILDPRTGGPANGPWRTVSVLADTCVGANVASTAAIVLGERAEEWLRRRGVAARLVAHDGRVLNLGGWPA